MSKITFLLALTTLFITSVYAQEVKPGNKKFLDYKCGFKDLKLGADISTISSFITKIPNDTSQTADGTNMYRVTDRSFMKIGDNITLKDIYVSIYKDRIHGILLHFDDQYADNIRSTFITAYGGVSSTLYPRRLFYTWKGNEVLLTLDIDQYTLDKVALFISIPIKQQIERDKKISSKSISDKL